MSSSQVLGQYLWHELLTPDPAGGAGFYSRVMGWNKMPYEGEAGYIMLGNAQGPVGGARVIGKDSLADQAGPRWLTYVGVPDLTAALATAGAKGGRILHPVTPVPNNGGRYAVIFDPQGAMIGLYEPGAGMSGDAAAPGAGPVSWHELTVENPQAALEFYKAIFGWEVVSTHEMGGDDGTYYLFGRGTTQMGGVFRYKNRAPGWMVYLSVPGVVAAAEAAKAAGGKVLNGPHEVPGGSWVAQLTDPHGVVIAVNGAKEAVATAPKAAAAPKAKTKAKSKAKSAPVKAKSKLKPKAKPKAKAKAKAKTKAKSKTAAKRKPAAKTKAKAKAKAKPKRVVKAKRKAGAKAKAKSKVKTKSAARGRKKARRGK